MFRRASRAWLTIRSASSFFSRITCRTRQLSNWEPQIVDLLEERPDRLALDLVRPAELPDHELAVAVDGHVLGAELPGRLQGLDQSGVLGHVVRRLAQKERLRQQPMAVDVVERETGRGGTGIAPTAAVRMNNHLHTCICAAVSTRILVQLGQRMISSRVISRLTLSAVMPMKQPPQLYVPCLPSCRSTWATASPS